MKIILALIFVFGLLTIVDVILFIVARKLKAGNKYIICIFILFVNSLLFDFIT
jgi:hypothetical protein